MQLHLGTGRSGADCMRLNLAMRHGGYVNESLLAFVRFESRPPECRWSVSAENRAIGPDSSAKLIFAYWTLA